MTPLPGQPPAGYVEVASPGGAIDPNSPEGAQIARAADSLSDLALDLFTGSFSPEARSRAVHYWRVSNWIRARLYLGLYGRRPIQPIGLTLPPRGPSGLRDDHYIGAITLPNYVPGGGGGGGGGGAIPIPPTYGDYDPTNPFNRILTEEGDWSTSGDYRPPPFDPSEPGSPGSDAALASLLVHEEEHTGDGGRLGGPPFTQAAVDRVKVHIEVMRRQQLLVNDYIRVRGSRFSDRDIEKLRSYNDYLQSVKELLLGNIPPAQRATVDMSIPAST